MNSGDFQTHMIFTTDFRNLINLFKQLGLGLRLQITEKDSKGESGIVNITWSQIQSDLSTPGKTFKFGR